MKIIEHIDTGNQFEYESIDFFIDETIQLGEVYIDGQLIFQATDVITDEELESEFYNNYQLIFDDSDSYELEIDEDIDFDDEY